MTKISEVREPVSLDALVRALVDLEVPGTVRVAQRLNEQGAEPREILAACERALTEIGERYETGEYFIAGLIMAGEIMNRVISLVAPRMAANVVNLLRGKVLIGTVKGDIHGLGKNIAGALLTAYGFEVRDLGVDVPVDDFVRQLEDFRPDIVGLSVLLTSCYPYLGETIAALRQVRGAGDQPAIFISGAQITPQHRQIYQADYQVDTAFDTVRLCEKLVRKGLDAPASGV